MIARQVRILMALAVVLAVVIVSIPFAAAPHHNPFTRAHSPYAHFILNSPAPPLVRSAAAPAMPTAAPAANSAHVQWRFLDPVDNQGYVGSCQCYSFRHQWDYLDNRRNHRPAHKKHYSCLWWYTEVTKGQDLGTAPTQYTATLASEGGVFHDAYDWTGLPMEPGSFPQPSWTYQEALANRWQSWYTFFGGGSGAGYGAIAQIERSIAGPRVPINIDIPVYGGQFGLYGNFKVDFPGRGDVEYGAHSVSLVGYMRNLTITVASGEQVTGWFLAQNSWGKDFGLNRSTLVHQANGHNGYFLISYRFVATYGWSIGRLHLGHGYPKAAPMAEAARPPVWQQPSPAVSHPMPAPRPLARASAHPGDWMYHVYARDLPGYDMAPTINAAAHYYGLLAPGLAATIGSECTLNTHSRECDRLGGGADYSFGACQVTIGTARGFGLGNGIYDGYDGPNTSLVRNYENDVVRCIWLGAKVLYSYMSYLAHRQYDPCPVNFPYLYVAWNAGPGNPCYFITNPTGQAGGNYYGTGPNTGFLSWWRWALSASTDRNLYAKPAPHFPAALWCGYAQSHHRACPAYRKGNRLSPHARAWWSHDLRCRGTTGIQSWHPQGRRGHSGYMKYVHARCALYLWPYHPGWKPTVRDP